MRWDIQLFDSEGLRKAVTVGDGADFQKPRAAAFSFLAADFIPPSIESTTFELRDRPYATILKSVLATLIYPNLP